MTSVDIIIRPVWPPVLTGSGPEYRRLLPIFERSFGAGLLAMLSGDPVPDAGPGFQFFRRAVRAFAMHTVRSGGDEMPQNFPRAEAADLTASLPLSPLALNLSQHQHLFHLVGSVHQVAKVLEHQHQSFQ